MLSLRNKHVILGITGGIAAYKSAELCRLLVKAGAEVRVVMTAAACEFITPLTMQALSGNKVHRDLLDEESEAGMGHIELARWADLVLVAPASADFIARLAHGEANDLLSTLCLASQAPLALAPAMNQVMWQKASTRDNLAELKNKQVSVFGPADGEQACGETGPGRMLEAEELGELAAGLFAVGTLAGLRVCINAGPTREALDPVRYLSNHSSGKMGYAIAAAAIEAGADVTLVSGPVSLPIPEPARVINVESAQQMYDACLNEACDIFIAVAAVADYRPLKQSREKIKKSTMTLSLELEKTPDILAAMAAQEKRPFCVGFAAETSELERYAKDKLADKNLDIIIANQATETFNQDEAAVTAYWKVGEQTFAPARKGSLARALIELVSERYNSSS
ncbi:MAG: bifunctional phosphopantothenoylcysteine decarboxylase/phosphopantothenate--cysteine ligase CoaBC [Gammaproteobacteria bacterium]|mgnify:FL=1|nr:bifunctional phosphopantothenoylcysteine decarboxylase/phosphopantothenate--cysteine ligase CoaBC [Gammaproteobacteria bacterium]